MAVHRDPGTTVETLATQFGVEPAVVRKAAGTLVAEGKLVRSGDGDGATLRALDLVVPIGSELGWEVAVFDHFRAVVNAIAAKVRRGRPRSQEDDPVGGTTLSFDIHDGHPFESRVERLLKDVRREVGALWADVEAYNAARAEKVTGERRVFFYFGQYVEEPDDGSAEER